MWDNILQYLKDNKDALGWLFGSGVVLAVLGGIYRFIVWLIKEYRLRRIRTNNNFPFKIIPPNSNVPKEILGGADDDPLADRNIPYQQRIQGRNTRRELEELIEDNRWILITGRTGLGKTREAVQLAQSLSNEGWTILFLTRETWLDAPAKLPNNVPERKILFLLDDLNKKCYSSKAEIRPDASDSLTISITEPFQIRLQRTLNAFDIFCGKSEIKVIATARNEKISEFDEPSEWDKLGWASYNNLWKEFQLIELSEPDKGAEQKLLTETAGKADVLIKSDELSTLVKSNDGTFRNLIENLSSAKTEGVALSSENFRDTLKGTWQKRYQKALQNYSEANFIYDAIELMTIVGLEVRFSNVLDVATSLASNSFIERLRFRRRCYRALKQLKKSENIFEPRDGQIEAKGYRINTKDHSKKLYFQITQRYFANQSLLKKLPIYLQLALLYPRKYFLDPNIDLTLLIIDNLFDLASDLNTIGNAFLDLGHASDALFYYDKSINLEQKSFRAWFSKRELSRVWTNKGRAFKFLKQYHEAIQACNEAIKFNKKFYFPWKTLGEVYSELMEFDNAKLAFEKAIQLDRKQVTPWLGLGYVYTDLGNYEEAITAFEMVTKRERKWATPWNALGFAYMQLARYDNAITAFQKATSLAPNWATPWNNLSHIYNDMHQVDSAIEACQKAIAISPKSPVSWVNLAIVYADSKRYDDAKSACEKAVELSPQDATSWYKLSAIYLTLKSFDIALTACQKAIELSPEDFAQRSSLVGILRRLNREDEAKIEEKVVRSLIGNEYNRACFESICGNTEEALRLLKIALEQKQTDIEWAQKDPDFDFIRDDPRFKELVGLE